MKKFTNGKKAEDYLIIRMNELRQAGTMPVSSGAMCGGVVKPKSKYYEKQKSDTDTPGRKSKNSGGSKN